MNKVFKLLVCCFIGHQVVACSGEVSTPDIEVVDKGPSNDQVTTYLVPPQFDGVVYLGQTQVVKAEQETATATTEEDQVFDFVYESKMDEKINLSMFQYTVGASCDYRLSKYWLEINEAGVLLSKEEADDLYSVDVKENGLYIMRVYFENLAGCQWVSSTIQIDSSL